MCVRAHSAAGPGSPAPTSPLGWLAYRRSQSFPTGASTSSICYAKLARAMHPRCTMRRAAPPATRCAPHPCMPCAPPSLCLYCVGHELPCQTAWISSSAWPRSGGRVLALVAWRGAACRCPSIARAHMRSEQCLVLQPQCFFFCLLREPSILALPTHLRPGRLTHAAGGQQAACQRPSRSNHTGCKWHRPIQANACKAKAS